MDVATIEQFWALVVEVWQSGIYGISISDSLLALLVILFALAMRNLFTRFVIKGIRRATLRTESKIDDHLLDALKDPIRFIPVVLGVFVASSLLDVGPELDALLVNLNRSLIAFALFWALHRATGSLGHFMLLAETFFTEAMVHWFVKVVRVLVIALGGATILEVWGISIGPVIAGLGLFGVAVALGAQNLFKNLIAGLFVIGERRFNVGDWILVDGVVEGTVEEIGFRTTMVRRFDQAPVYIPNSELSDNAMTNFSRMTHRRIRWLIGLEYRTSHEQLCAIRDRIARYLSEHDEFAVAPEVSTFVRVDAFSDSSIDLLLYCFTRTTIWGEWLEIKERLALAIKAIVEEEGAGFAFPSRSLYLESLPALDGTEVFAGRMVAQGDAAPTTGGRN